MSEEFEPQPRGLFGVTRGGVPSRAIQVSLRNSARPKNSKLSHEIESLTWISYAMSQEIGVKGVQFEDEKCFF